MGGDGFITAGSGRREVLTAGVTWTLKRVVRAAVRLLDDTVLEAEWDCF